jgi:hypothetical protein
MYSCCSATFDKHERFGLLDSTDGLSVPGSEPVYSRMRRARSLPLSRTRPGTEVQDDSEAKAMKGLRTIKLMCAHLGRTVAVRLRDALHRLVGSLPARVRVHIRGTRERFRWPLPRSARTRRTQASHQRTLIPAEEADRPVYARARPESVRLTETYFYDRVIARNHATETGQQPTGRIKIVVPYDGERYFGLQGYQDVQRQLSTTAPTSADALIGHLALMNYGRTNLASLLDLSDTFGSVPLRVPVMKGDIDELDWLRADRYACVIEYEYFPAGPAIIPIEVQMDLLDAESQTPRGESSKTLVGEVAQFEGFHPDLELSMSVTLHLPDRMKPPLSQARVRRMSLDWPTITSLRGLRLEVGDQSHPLAYDPATRSLQWTDVPIDPVEEELVGTDLRRYSSPPMRLFIHQPGELYEQDSLRGRVEVEIPGRLLSGLQARLYDGTGRRSKNPKPKMSSRLIADVRLVLDEAFARRVLTPYLSLHFDEVIPDVMRLADIQGALRDRGFRIESSGRLSAAESNELSYFLVASHPKGPDVMRLWLLVEGKQSSTQRETQIPGGLTYTSTFESGELKIHMGGALPADSEGVTHEMNELQVALRDRFERLRTKR